MEEAGRSTACQVAGSTSIDRRHLERERALCSSVCSRTGRTGESSVLQQTVKVLRAVWLPQHDPTVSKSASTVRRFSVAAKNFPQWYGR